MVTRLEDRLFFEFTATSRIENLSFSLLKPKEVTRGSLTSREWRSWLNSASNRTVAKRVRGGEKSGPNDAFHGSCPARYTDNTAAQGAGFCRDARDAFSNYHRSNCRTKEHPGKGWFDRLIRPLSANGRKRNANARDPPSSGARAEITRGDTREQSRISRNY